MRSLFRVLRGHRRSPLRGHRAISLITGSMDVRSTRDNCVAFAPPSATQAWNLTSPCCRSETSVTTTARPRW